MNEVINLTPHRKIGEGHPAYIIAEIGSNHDGELDRAKMLITRAKESGADAAKFQSFQVEKLINPLYKMRKVWKASPFWDNLKKLSIPESWHKTLQEYAKKIEIDFFTTPFDLDRMKLMGELNVPAIKIASGDLTNDELLRAAADLNKPIFLSTGAAYLEEVERAMKVLSLAGAEDVVLLQCTSVYPPAFTDINVTAMTTLKNVFHVPVGYSDHAPGSAVVLGAIALGACVVEKHLTDDNTRLGPDHPSALNPKDFKDMVKNIRNLELSLGNGIKKPCSNEESERIFARRGIYANVDIKKGTNLTRDMVKFVRPIYPEGIPSLNWRDIEGKPLANDIQMNQILTWEMF
jgi:sialic acid synthase SpsE